MNRIKSVEVFGVEVPLVGEYKNAYKSKSIQRSAVVRITTTHGAVGLGNIDPSPGYSMESIEQSLWVLQQQLAPAIVGMDPTNIHEILGHIEPLIVGFHDAKAAIEMACMDLSARLARMPLYTFLGGLMTPVVRLNAWIGILPPEEAAAQTKAWQDQGFKSCKIKVGADIYADEQRVKAVRQAVGADFNIRIDANAGYDEATSIQLCRLVAPYGLQLFEQPVAFDNIEGLARVRKEANAMGLAIMADESVLDHASLIRIIKAEAADIVKVKVMKQGGFLNTRRMIATAEAAGIRCVVGHGFGLGINTMAEIMLAATSTNVLEGLECVGPLKTSDDIVTQRLDFSSGQFCLPKVEGLGVELDEVKIKKYQFDIVKV